VWQIEGRQSSQLPIFLKQCFFFADSNGHFDPELPNAASYGRRRSRAVLYQLSGHYKQDKIKTKLKLNNVSTPVGCFSTGGSSLCVIKKKENLLSYWNELLIYVWSCRKLIKVMAHAIGGGKCVTSQYYYYHFHHYYYYYKCLKLEYKCHIKWRKIWVLRARAVTSFGHNMYKLYISGPLLEPANPIFYLLEGVCSTEQSAAYSKAQHVPSFKLLLYCYLYIHSELS